LQRVRLVQRALTVFAALAKKTVSLDCLVQLSPTPLPHQGLWKFTVSPKCFGHAEHIITSVGSEYCLQAVLSESVQSCTGAILLDEVLIAALQDIRVVLVVERFPLHK
jgi:hypothetical protein